MAIYTQQTDCQHNLVDIDNLPGAETPNIQPTFHKRLHKDSSNVVHYKTIYGDNLNCLYIRVDNLEDYQYMSVNTNKKLVHLQVDSYYTNHKEMVDMDLRDLLELEWL